MGNRSLLLAAALLVSLPAAAIPEPAGLALGLRAPANEAPAFVLAGNGVYIYQCRQSALDPNLYESMSDRSSTSGVVRGSQAAGTANLPWVSMRAQPLSESGMFAGVTTIQRVNTNGGAAPGGGCGPDNIGAEARVAFRADYYFYKQRGAP